MDYAIDLSFDEVIAELNYMKANPQYILSHMSYFLNNWYDCILDAIDYISCAMNDAPKDELSEPVINTLVLGFLILPSIVYMEDTEISYKLFNAICLLMYNLAQILDNNDLKSIFEANMNIFKQRDSLKSLIELAQRIMIQYQTMNLGNKSSDPYQLSINYLRQLTDLGEDNTND